MRILQFCNKPPYPPLDGGAIGMNNVTQGLIGEGHEVKVLALNTPKHHVNIEDLPSEYARQTRIEFVLSDTRVKALPAFLNLFTDKSYNIRRFWSHDAAGKLRNILAVERFDIVQVESIFLSEYIPVIRESCSARIVFRAPNVEYLIWERRAVQCRNPLKKAYLKLLAGRLKRTEAGIAVKVDGIYTVTAEDMEFFRNTGATVPMTFIPTGIDMTKSQEPGKDTGDFPSLFHIGAMDWVPNQEAFRWFLEQVWPAVNQKHPQAKLYLAGRRTPEWMMRLDVPNVVVLGEIADAAAFIRSKSVMVVPLFSGGGMRVKIIEGWMLGKAVISTSIGAEGLVYENGKDILIADTAEEFIRAIGRCLDDRDFCMELGMKGRENAMKHYDNKVLAENLAGFMQKVLEGSSEK